MVCRIMDAIIYAIGLSLVRVRKRMGRDDYFLLLYETGQQSGGEGSANPSYAGLNGSIVTCPGTMVVQQTPD